MQRLRVKYQRGENLKFVSHLDIIRLWQRAFYRAGVEPAYSEGFNPHPRMALASPLPVGYTSRAEFMDLYTSAALSPHYFEDLINRQLPEGVKILQSCVVPLEQDSLQALVRQAEYLVDVRTCMSLAECRQAVDEFLAKDILVWQLQRQDKVKEYDLRVQVAELEVVSLAEGVLRLRMLLQCDSKGAGRPEQLTKALGITEFPLSVERRRLVLEA
ncbi:TIGR03936 family radical SAM-associated protein [Dehalococcoides mccartyi]|uniref:TIGR03936 family radical SAM-associated protein n=1 Tax=Dehalococcoides mccartyi TaxID=61435 RepID=UPI00398BB1C6